MSVVDRPGNNKARTGEIGFPVGNVKIKSNKCSESSCYPFSPNVTAKMPH